jgi:Xaa-Pro aminopeptidase
MTELPGIDASGRASLVRELFIQRHPGVEALVVGDLTNIRWLTGFSGSNGWAVLLPDEVVLVTDGRYGEQAERQLAAARVAGRVAVGRTATELHGLLADALHGTSRVGFESAHLRHLDFVRLGEALDQEWVPTVGIVERGRRRKDPAELERIVAACRIADRALALVAPMLGDGLTEVEVRNRLEVTMRELGAAGPSYETIVASGPVNAPLPHHRPTPTRIDDGHTVIIDVGALVDGYHSDMTRTFVVGEPTSLQAEVYHVVLAAQQAGVAAVRAGIDSAELDAVCRSIIADAGFGPWFTHGTGHGVGLLIHEDPFLNQAGGWCLEEGDVVTVEPGLYRGDFGGVRVEDLVEVTATGCRVLTQFPKDTPCLPSAPTT